MEANHISLVVQDPEGIVATGFRLKFEFRSKYFQQVFVSRATEVLGLAPPPKKPPESRPTKDTTTTDLDVVRMVMVTLGLILASIFGLLIFGGLANR